MSVHCDGVGCHDLRLYIVVGWGVMSCDYTVTGGLSCPVSAYCDCHILCQKTLTGWGVMICVCILWHGGVS